MTTIIIEESSSQAKQLLEYIKTLPFVTIVDEKKKSFHEAAEECNAVTVDTFFDELDNRIKKHFNPRYVGVRSKAPALQSKAGAFVLTQRNGTLR